MKNPNFYSVIIGTELLNRRREDAHFSVLAEELLKRGWEYKANFIIKDDPKFLKDIFTLIKSDPQSVMFSFGGIGSTPDDFTREVASIAFTQQPPYRHKEAEKIIVERLGERAYPHPITMADIPKGSQLIENPINRMPGFQIENRFFFVPGFPQMAHPMIKNILNEFYPKNSTKFNCNFMAYCGEATMIDIMRQLPSDIELSCLPIMSGEKKQAEIFLSSMDKTMLERWCGFFKDELTKIDVEYEDIIK